MKKLLLALVLVSVGEVMADTLPNGPYLLQNCYYCEFVSNELNCSCHDPKGGRHNTSLIVNPAQKRPIVNNNGFLSFELPKGPYLQDCYYCKFDEKNVNVLKCRCHDVDGGRHDSSLTVNPAETRTIGNNNGFLSFDLPKGDYQESCPNCSYKNNLLYCKCKSRDGKKKSSSLTVTPQETRNVGNNDGTLSFPLPNGDYQKNCKNCTFDGNNLLKCDCNKADGTSYPSSLTVNPGETRTISVNKDGKLQFDN